MPMTVTAQLYLTGQTLYAGESAATVAAMKKEISFLETQVLPTLDKQYNLRLDSNINISRYSSFEDDGELQREADGINKLYNWLIKGAKDRLKELQERIPTVAEKINSGTLGGLMATPAISSFHPRIVPIITSYLA